MLAWFRVAPGETSRIPLLIGTASFTPRLGYMIPAGDWGIQATLKLGPVNSTRPPEPAWQPLENRRTPVLSLTVTA